MRIIAWIFTVLIFSASSFANNRVSADRFLDPRFGSARPHVMPVPVGVDKDLFKKSEILATLVEKFESWRRNLLSRNFGTDLEKIVDRVRELPDLWRHSGKDPEAEKDPELDERQAGRMPIEKARLAVTTQRSNFFEEPNDRFGLKTFAKAMAGWLVPGIQKFGGEGDDDDDAGGNGAVGDATNSGTQNRELMMINFEDIEIETAPHPNGRGKRFVDVEIGRGHHGPVYAATYRGAPVACKELYSSWPFAEVVLREAAVISRLAHPNIAKLIGVVIRDINGNREFLLVTPRLWRDLNSIDRNSMPPVDKIKIMTECAEGLSYLHAKGVIHENIKPSNILLSNDPRGTWRAVLTDFGIAKTCQQIIVAKSVADARTVYILDPEYKCPELLRGEELADPTKGDIYAFGASMFALWTGQAPALDNVNFNLLGQHGCSSLVSDLIRNMMDPNPGNRPTAADISMRLTPNAMIPDNELNFETFQTARGTTVRNELVVLNRGAGAFIYAALYRGVPVACKVPSIDRGVLAPAMQERRLLSGLNHPNVVKMHGIAIVERGARETTLVFERLWHSLQWLLMSSNIHLSVEQRLAIMTQCAEALAHLHGNQPWPVVHGNIKLAHIMLSADPSSHDPWRAVIIGFGEAKAYDVTPGQEPSGGTPSYASPEAERGQPVADPTKADIYSLGATMFTLWTRHAPPENLAQHHALFTNSDSPADVAELIGRMMSQLPAERPSAREILDILGTITSQRSSDHSETP